MGQNRMFTVLTVSGGIKHFIAFTLILALAFPVRIWFPLGPFVSFSPMDIVLLMGLAGLLEHAIATGILRTGRRSLAIALAMPVIFCYLSFLWTVNLTETLKAALTYTEALAAFVITIFVFDDLRSETIGRLLGIFVFAIVLTAILSAMGFPGLAQQIPPNLVPGSPDYTAFALSYHARLSHPFIGLSNNLATVLAFFPIVFTAYAKATKRNSFHWLAVLCILAVVLTLSRGAIGALVLAYGLYALGHRGSLKRLWKGGTALALIVAGLFAFVMLNPLVGRHVAYRLSMINIDYRLEAWRAVWGALADRPFWGFGAGVSLSEATGSLLQNAHNAFLAQLFYFGLPGGLLVGVSILSLPVIFSRWRLSGSKARIMRRSIVFSLATQILIFLSQASFEGSVLRVVFYFSVGASVMLLKALEHEAVFDSSVPDGRAGTTFP